ncbi:MAG: methyl-accepting chemotaxis protein [Neptuniibacter sp.]
MNSISSFISKENIKESSISTQIMSGFGIMVVLLIAVGIAGIYGFSQLRGSLNYITTQAWDTADGAMEGTIGIEAEMLGVERSLQRISGSQPVDPMVEEGRATAEEALERMLNAGLLSQTQIDEMQILRKDFQKTTHQLLTTHQKFLEDRDRLNTNFKAFEALMAEAEEIGDGQVEQLRASPDMLVSWNKGLSQRWTAADGAMEASIGMLQRIYYFERLTAGDNREEALENLDDALSFMMESFEEITAHPIFKKASVPSGEYKGQSFSNAIQDSLDKHKTDFNDAVFSFTAYDRSQKIYSKSANALLSSIEVIEEAGDSTVEGEVGQISTMADRLLFLMISVLVVGCILGGIAAFLIVRNINTPLSAAVHIANAVARGELNNKIKNKGAKEIRELLKSLETMQSNLRERIERDFKQSQENGRIKEALDKAGASVMLIDKDQKIIYANDSALNLFKRSESDLTDALPEFNTQHLIGSHISVFNSGIKQLPVIDGQTLILDHLYEIGTKSFLLSANPIVNNSAEHIGTVIEWKDKTDEVLVQKEVQAIVENAMNGNLTDRITVQDKQGFFKTLSEGINSLLQVSEQVVGDISQVMSSIARGNLDNTIERHYQGDFLSLKEDTNTAIEQLRQVISEIATTSTSVRQDANEIADGNESLRQRTVQQSSSIEDTASSMEEMMATVKTNADSALLANDLAKESRKLAASGGTVAQEAISSMDQIHQASNKIATIIAVIDEIAFQTNLLALNASVEAARAGESGRGFAVVASEVRNLAQRSAAAASEIKDMINDSVSKVEEGSQLVHACGETLEEISESISKVSEIVEDISIASAEQNTGLQKIGGEINKIDDMTQQNAGLVETATQTSVSLRESARKMTTSVEFFSAH